MTEQAKKTGGLSNARLFTTDEFAEVFKERDLLRSLMLELIDAGWDSYSAVSPALTNQTWDRQAVKESTKRWDDAVAAAKDRGNVSVPKFVAERDAYKKALGELVEAEEEYIIILNKPNYRDLYASTKRYSAAKAAAKKLLEQP